MATVSITSYHFSLSLNTAVNQATPPAAHLNIKSDIKLMLVRKTDTLAA